jgi:hypothetical protein
MPFQPINFANIAPLGLPGIASAPEQIAKGFNLSQLPEEARTRMLANAFSQMKNEQEPQRFQSEQALQSAQTQKSGQESLKLKMIQDLMSGKQEMKQGNSEGIQQYLLNKTLFGQAELPDQKRSREMESFKDKELFKRKQALEQPPSDIVSKYTQRTDQVEPFINSMNSLVNMPSPTEVVGGIYRPDAAAKHKSTVDSAADTYLSLRGLQGTVENINLAKNIIGRHRFEGDKAYRERIKDVLHDVMSGAAPYYKTLNRDMPESMQNILDGNKNKQDLADPLGLR